MTPASTIRSAPRGLALPQLCGRAQGTSGPCCCRRRGQAVKSLNGDRLPNGYSLGLVVSGQVKFMGGGPRALPGALSSRAPSGSRPAQGLPCGAGIILSPGELAAFCHIAAVRLEGILPRWAPPRCVLH